MTRHTRLLGRLALACLTATAAVNAQSPRDSRLSPSGPDASAAAARVTGRVIDATDGRTPVHRVIVTISGDALPAGRSRITGDDGRFEFEHVPDGRFIVSATRGGYLPAAFGAARAGRPGTPVTVAAGKDALDLAVVLTHGSALDGTLHDVAGDPALGMRVEAIRILHGASGDRGETAGAALTDDRGAFRIFDLPAGDYVLAATATTIVTGIGDIGAPSEADVDALLASIGRRANAPPGAPAPAAPPHVLKAYGTPPVFYPGVLNSGDATRISLGTNDTRDGLDFAIMLGHAANVDGAIVPVPGQPVPPVLVRIRGAGPELPVYGGGAGGPSVSVRTSDHTFHISNVPPGHYRVTARTVGGGTAGTAISSGGALPSPAAGGALWALAELDIGGDDVGGVTLALKPALQMTGRIVFDTTTQRTPEDASAVRISLEPLATDNTGLAAAVPASVDRTGAFTFPGVLPGDYRLIVSAPDGWRARSALASARDGRDLLDTGVTVVASNLSGITVTLSDRHSAIAGTLTSAVGRAAPDYFLVAFSADCAHWHAPSRRVVSVRPATDGAFEVRDLPAGAYYLAALTDVEPSDLEDAAFLESLVPTAASVTLGDGERKVQNLRIGSGSRP